LLMVIITTLLWAWLPILQKIALKEFSPGTVVAFRFLSAFIILYPWLQLKGSNPWAIIRRPPFLGVLAGVCLAGNYYGMIKGIHLSTPTNTAIMIQLAPVILVFVGMFYFNERLKRPQIFGGVAAAIGFLLFYMDQKNHTIDKELFDFANYYILFAAFVWVGFMVCQKLLKQDAQLLNLLIFGTAAIVLLPWMQWSELAGASFGYWLLIISLGLNTLIAYGTLGEAVKCLPLSYISVIVTLNPLITLAAMQVLPIINPAWVEAEALGAVGYIGALGAIAGVVMVVKNH
ncbi:MAG: hypothetical protein A3K09_07755, partial [Nitrospinae bacterium RIFCSPLOWO2_12_FULL_47_7]